MRDAASAGTGGDGMTGIELYELHRRLLDELARRRCESCGGGAEHVDPDGGVFCRQCVEASGGEACWGVARAFVLGLEGSGSLLTTTGFAKRTGAKLAACASVKRHVSVCMRRNLFADTPYVATTHVRESTLRSFTTGDRPTADWRTERSGGNGRGQVRVSEVQ